MPRLPHPPATPKAPTLARAARDWSGWFVVAAGAVLCVLGWYGISGESVIEQQLPYLASATIPGAALIVAGALLLVSRPARRTEQADRRIETLYALLVADTGEHTEASAPSTREEPDAAPALLAVPGGTLYHRRDCPLVADKPTAEAIDPATAAARALIPCSVCEPPEPPPGGSGGPGPERPVPGAGGPGGAGSDQPPDAGPGRSGSDASADRRATSSGSDQAPAADLPASGDHPAPPAADSGRRTDLRRSVADRRAISSDHAGSASSPAPAADLFASSDRLAPPAANPDRSASGLGQAPTPHPHQAAP